MCLEKLHNLSSLVYRCAHVGIHTYRMDTSLRQTFGKNVRALREEMGLSQGRFSMMVGISRPLLNRIEQGNQNVTLDTLDRIAKGLNIEAWKLLRQ